MSSIARGTLVNLVTRVLGVALGLSIMWVTARLGTAEQGAYALFAAVESALLALGSGFSVWLARRVSHFGEKPAALVGAVTAACLVLGVICMAALLLVAQVRPHDLGFLRVLAVAAPLLFVTPSLSGLWLGQGHMVALARLTLAVPLLTLLGMGLGGLLPGQIDIQTVLWSWVGARLSVAGITLFIICKQGGMATPAWAPLKNDARFLMVIGLTNLIGLLNYKADLFLVEYFLGRQSTGVYSVAVMVAELLWLVSSSLSQAAYARIGHPDRHHAGRLTLRVVQISMLALAALAPLIWFAAAWLLPAVLGPEYATSVALLGWLLPGVLVFGAASVISAYFTNHAGRPLIPATLAGLSLTINVIVSVCLIPRWGMLGGAVATTVSYILAVVVSLVIFLRMAAIPARALFQPDWQAMKADGLKAIRRPSHT